MMPERCVVCGSIPLVKIHTPDEYRMCLESFIRMIMADQVSVVYQTTPLDKVVVDGKFTRVKNFHQFKCNACGCLYGMYVDATQGGEIKQNIKMFILEEYEDA